MSEKLNALATHLTARHGDKIAATIAFDELTLTVGLGDLVALIADLKDDPVCKFNMLIDISAVDYPTRLERFEIVYLFLYPLGLLQGLQASRLSLPVSIRVANKACSRTCE